MHVISKATIVQLDSLRNPKSIKNIDKTEIKNFELFKKALTLLRTKKQNDINHRMNITSDL